MILHYTLLPKHRVPCKSYIKSLQTAENLVNTLTEINKDGIKAIGLAAPQIGHNDQVFVIFDGEEYHKFIYPYILNQSNPMIVNEGCLSVPERTCRVARYHDIEVEYQKVGETEGDRESRSLSFLMAFAFQHEYDHLNGLTILDREIK